MTCADCGEPDADLDRDAPEAIALCDACAWRREVERLRSVIDRAATLLHEGLRERSTIKTREGKALGHAMTEARKLLRSVVPFEEPGVNPECKT